MLKNTADQKVLIFAYDIANNEAKTGDAANITSYLSKDGTVPVQSNDVNPTELDAVNMPGVYVFDLTQAETNADTFFLYAKTNTTDIQIDPVRIETQSGFGNKFMTNLRNQNKLTGVITIYDDDGETPILILTPSDDGVNITLTPSEPEV